MESTSTAEASEQERMKDWAFNVGCDIRLAGGSFNNNPFDDPVLANCWDRGWLDCDLFFGAVDVNWAVQKLPAVAEAA